MGLQIKRHSMVKCEKPNPNAELQGTIHQVSSHKKTMGQFRSRKSGYRGPCKLLTELDQTCVIQSQILEDETRGSYLGRSSRYRGHFQSGCLCGFSTPAAPGYCGLYHYLSCRSPLLHYSIAIPRETLHSDVTHVTIGTACSSYCPCHKTPPPTT